MKRDIYTPEMIVAGVKEFGSVSPREAAFNALAFTLNTEEVVLIYKVVGNQVHYAGSPSSYFINQGESYSPLFQVLGSEDGAYIIDETAYSILVIKTENSYETFSNTYDQARQICQERDLEPVVLNEDSQLEKWVSITFENARKSRSFNDKIIIYAALGSVLGAVLWAGMAISEGSLQKSSYNYDLSAQAKIAKIIEEIPTYQPVDEVIADLSITKSVAAKSGGWINRFTVRDNKTGIEILMPQWVTRDYISPLGQVKAERSKEYNTMIKISRKINTSE